MKMKSEILININDEIIKLNEEDFEIIEKINENIAKIESDDIILLLDKTITTELKVEGLAREIVRRIQSMRKELDLKVEDKIKTKISIDKDNAKSLEPWIDYIKEETRSKEVNIGDKLTGKLIKKWKIDELEIDIGINT